MLIKNINTYCVLFLFFNLLVAELRSQAPLGELVDVYTLPNYDTLLLNRTHGSFWLGIASGANVSLYYDALRTPLNPLRPSDTTNSIIEFPGGKGAGYFVGLFGEWLPPGKLFGLSLKVLLFEYRKAIAETDPYILDTIKLTYEHRSNLYYLSVQPSVRYNFPISGLHAYIGFDFEISTGHKTNLRYKFENTGQIQDDRILPLSGFNTRYGAHLGVGWDIFVTDINHKMRLNFTPFISIHGGTPILSDYNSSWNTAILRAGLTVKIGPDNITADTLYFDPSYIRPPELLASIEKPEIIFPGFLPINALPALDLAYVEKPEIVEEISEKKIVPPVVPEVVSEVVKNPVMPKKTEKFTFPTTAETNLDKNMRDYLDRLAEFLKANPGYEVRIIGHSDNTGTYEQNYRRSVERANQVVMYLQKKGVARSRLLDYAKGALEPAASNETAAGRRANRRVEVTVIDKR